LSLTTNHSTQIDIECQLEIGASDKVFTVDFSLKNFINSSIFNLIYSFPDVVFMDFHGILYTCHPHEVKNLSFSKKYSKLIFFNLEGSIMQLFSMVAKLYSKSLIFSSKRFINSLVSYRSTSESHPLLAYRVLM